MVYHRRLGSEVKPAQQLRILMQNFGRHRVMLTQMIETDCNRSYVELLSFQESLLTTGDTGQSSSALGNFGALNLWGPFV
jgi:hypothetical protein